MKIYMERRKVSVSGFQLEQIEAASIINLKSSSSAAHSAASSDLMEVATSPSSSSSSSSTNGPLYELSELMAQLPIKRGLSKYYGGKSESFTSLASVERIEDLPKRENRCRKKKMKLCDSYDGGFDGHKFQSPKATIKKKSSSRGSALPTMARNDLIHSCRPPHLPVLQHF